MAEKEKQEIFMEYRPNKGYFYGPGAGKELVGQPVDWNSTPSQQRDRIKAAVDTMV